MTLEVAPQESVIRLKRLMESITKANGYENDVQWVDMEYAQLRDPLSMEKWPRIVIRDGGERLDDQMSGRVRVVWTYFLKCFTALLDEKGALARETQGTTVSLMRTMQGFKRDVIQAFYSDPMLIGPIADPDGDGNDRQLILNSIKECITDEGFQIPLVEFSLKCEATYDFVED